MGLHLLADLELGLPAAFLAGFIDSMAGGGGILTLPALVLMDLTPATAVGTNKLVGVFGAASATWQYARKGKVRWPAVRWLLPLALAGGALGARAILFLHSPALFRHLVAFLVLAVGLIVLFHRSLGREPSRPRLTLAQAAPLIPLIAFYDGFFGPGTGTFLMFLWVAALGYDFVEGSAQARSLNLASNAGALLTFLLGGHLIYLIGLPMGLLNAVGAALVARVALRRGNALVRSAYLLIVVLVVTRLLL